MKLPRVFLFIVAVFALVSGKVFASVPRLAADLQFLQRAVAQRDIVALQEFLTKIDIDKSDTYGWTLLHYAALEGLLPAAELLQRLGAATDPTDNNGLSPAAYADFGGHLEVSRLLQGVAPAEVDLFTAAAANSQRAIERLLATPEIDIDARTDDGQTALHLSAAQGHLYATQRLIDAGADLMARDADGKLPFDLAADAGHALVASVLLEVTAGLNMKDFKGWTPLNWALLSGDQQRVHDLLAKGAKVGEGCQNALEVCLILQDMEMFALVLAAGGIDAASHRGDTALMGAAKRGDEQVVDTLLAYTANPNVMDRQHGFTPLRLAAEEGYLRIVEKLIANGALLNTVDTIGYTAIMRAALRGHVEVVRALIASGADVNIAGAAGMTALMWAVFWNEKEIARLLLEGGADIHAVTDAGVSVLELAVERGDAEMLDILLAQDVPITALPMGLSDAEILLAYVGDRDVLEKARSKKLKQRTVFPLIKEVQRDSPLVESWLMSGADPNRADADGNPPIIWAALLGHKEAVKTLLAWRADPDVLDKELFSALMRAAAAGYLEVVEPLLLEGADPHLVNGDGDDALALAERNGHREIAKILREAKGVEE